MIAAAETRWPIPQLARTSGAAELNLSSVLSALSYALLEKPGKLDEAEWTAMRLHPVYTNDILERVDAFRSLAPLASTHHEKLDGSGYPYGVHGDRLNLDARILVVADIFEALTADRPYRAGMPVEEALALMSRDAGTRLDATVLEALPEALSWCPS